MLLCTATFHNDQKYKRELKAIQLIRMGNETDETEVPAAHKPLLSSDPNYGLHQRKGQLQPDGCREAAPNGQKEHRVELVYHARISQMDVAKLLRMAKDHQVELVYDATMLRWHMSKGNRWKAKLSRLRQNPDYELLYVLFPQQYAHFRNMSTT